MLTVPLLVSPAAGALPPAAALPAGAALPPLLLHAANANTAVAASTPTLVSFMHYSS